MNRKLIFCLTYVPFFLIGLGLLVCWLANLGTKWLDSASFICLGCFVVGTVMNDQRKLREKQRRSSSKRLTEQQLAELGFERRGDVNPPLPECYHPYIYVSRSMFLKVRDGGELDGELILDYSGGNITIQNFDHLKQLVQVIDTGHGK